MSRFLFPLCICFALSVLPAGCNKARVLAHSQASATEEVFQSPDYQTQSGIEVEGQPHSYIVTKYLD